MPAANDADEVGWFDFDELQALDIHPSVTRQIDAHLSGVRSHVD